MTRIKDKEVIEDLMKPRYKVIGDYPGSEFAKDQILIPAMANDRYAFKSGLILTLAAFPHLFKKLEWWEDRKPEEMPKYVKEEGGRVYLSKWKIKDYLILYDAPGELQCAEYSVSEKVMCFFQPATETEYLNYIKEKK